MMNDGSLEKIGLTGATGYVGGRLLPLLEAKGYRVRCLCRKPAHLTSKVGKNTEVVKADLSNYDDLIPALSGLAAVYFLVHSLGSSKNFEEDEEKTARNFAKAA